MIFLITFTQDYIRSLASAIKEPMQFIKEEIKQFCLEIMWLLFPPRKSTRINYKDSRILSKLSDIMGCKVSDQKPIVFYRSTVKFGLWELKDGSLLNITKILYIKLIKCMQDLYAENWKEKQWKEKNLRLNKQTDLPHSWLRRLLTMFTTTLIEMLVKFSNWYCKLLLKVVWDND